MISVKVNKVWEKEFYCSKCKQKIHVLSENDGKVHYCQYCGTRTRFVKMAQVYKKNEKCQWKRV